MYLIHRQWRKLLGTDRLGAALRILHDGVVYAEELRIDQLRGMRYLHCRGFLSLDSPQNGTALDEHWHVAGATLPSRALTAWVAKEARRLRYDMETYNFRVPPDEQYAASTV